MQTRELLLFPLLLGVAVACRPLASGRISIADVARQAPETVVQVAGTVQQQAPFLQGGAYQLADPSGTIWVFTEQPLPPQGRSVAIAGKVVYEAVEMAGSDFGEVYLQELERP